MIPFDVLLEDLRIEQSKPSDISQIIAEQTKLPINIVKKGINEGFLKINNNVVKNCMIRLHATLEVSFQDQRIKIVIKETTYFDRFIIFLLTRNFDNQSINSLSTDNKLLFFSFVLEFFSKREYNGVELSKSSFNNAVMEGLEDFFKSYLGAFPEIKNLRRRDLVGKALEIRNNSLANFKRVIHSTISKLYTKPEQSLNDFRHIFKERGFTLLARPYLTQEVDFLLIIERLIKNYNLFIDSETQSEKINKRSIVLDDYDSIKENYFNNKSDEISKEFLVLIRFFREQCNVVPGIQDKGKALIRITSEERTYNFLQPSFYVYANLDNSGTGIAKNIKIECSSDHVKFEPQEIADILPANESRKIKFSIKKLENQGSVNLKFTIKWETESKEIQELKVNKFIIYQQDNDLPWEELKRSNPYNSSQIVDDPDKLYGREQLIDDLRWNIERNNFISSFILYGQKRVGKSSIVRTLETIYKNDPNVIFVYKTMADVKDHLDPSRTFQRIGEVFSTKILHEYRRKIKPKNEDQIAVSKLVFTGSLSPLTDLIDQIHSQNEGIRFIIVIDEFDELNKEFFDTGELAKTFALSIGKGLNEKNYIGIILVGSENMISKASQGMRLNTFQIKKVDTFDKVTEFDSYCQIILAPGKSCLSFDVEVLNLLYDYTNGNPYFTNLLANRIFLNAYDRKIAHIDFDFAMSVIKHHVSLMSNNDFEHFWADSLSEKAISYEKILDRRKRLLTAFAQTKNESRSLTWSEIKRKIRYSSKLGLTEDQMEDTLNEYKERGIVKENPDKTFQIIPRLFEEWLFTVGIYQVIAQLDDKDEILDKVKQDQKLRLSEEELIEIVNHLDEAGVKLLPSLKRFLEQFEEHYDKRVITDLLKKMVVIYPDEIADHLKKVRKSIWGEIHLNVGDADIRTDAEIVCFNHSYEQNKPNAGLLKDVFKFVHNKSVKFINNLSSLTKETKHLIIYEPLIDCPFYYRNEFSTLLKSINPILANTLDIQIICFVITDEAKEAIEGLLSSHFLFKFAIHTVRVTQRSDISPFINSSNTINDPAWKLLTELDPSIDDTSCLVKIGQILPFQNIPLLWSNEYEKFTPLIYQPVAKSIYHNKINFSKILKDLKFLSESNRLELKGTMTEPTHNWKKIRDLVAQLSNMNLPDKIRENKINEISVLWTLKFPSAEKESLRRYVKHSLVKNLAAFANTKGGDIYVGIEDDFTVQGIIQDQVQYITQEGIRRAFDNLVNEYLGREYSAMFDLKFINLPNGSTVLHISVSKGDQPQGIWVKISKEGLKLSSNNEEFYIRGQQETNLLSAREFANWSR